MTDAVGPATWNARAAVAEQAILARFVVRVPGLAWGRSAWPPLPRAVRRREGRAGWHYWWSAHLVDALVDAELHRPDPRRRARLRPIIRGIAVRNGFTLSRRFWDDLAWLGLALERAEPFAGRRRAVERIAGALAAAVDPAVGAIPWRVGDGLYNAPANGPAAILFARTGRVELAGALADWLHDRLRDERTGLLADGIVVAGGDEHPVADLYTYCQGVGIGADLALAAAGVPRHGERAAALIAAVERWTAIDDGVLPGSGGGDGGLFAGITCRYLADAARRLADAQPAAAASARRLVLQSAVALWRGAAMIDGRPLFAADARRAADRAPRAPERDLSVQLGAWLTLEAAVEVTS